MPSEQILQVEQAHVEIIPHSNPLVDIDGKPVPGGVYRVEVVRRVVKIGELREKDNVITDFKPLAAEVSQ